MRFRRKIALLAVWFAGTWQRPAHAESSASEAQRVEITLVGEWQRDPAFSERVTSWFDRHRFAVEIRSAAALDAARVLAPERAAVVFVWVTLADEGRVRLFFTSAGAAPRAETSYLLRELVLERGMDEIGAERVAQVLFLSTVALLEGQDRSGREVIERGLEQTAPALKASEPPRASAARANADVKSVPAVEPEPAASSAVSKRGARVRGGAGYGASYRSEEGLWHGPRLGLGVFWPSGLGARTAVATALPHREQFSALDLEFSAASLLGAFAFRSELSSHTSLTAFAGPALELVRFEAGPAADPNVTPNGSKLSVRPGAALGVAAALGSSPSVALLVEASFAFVRTRYELDTVRGREFVGSAAWVTPSAGLELGF